MRSTLLASTGLVFSTVVLAQLLPNFSSDLDANNVNTFVQTTSSVASSTGEATTSVVAFTPSITSVNASATQSTIASPLPQAISNRVDTISNSSGVPSTAEIKAAKLSNFCSLTTTTSKTCKTLQNTVAVCIDNGNNCTESNTRTLLSTIVDSNPCNTATSNTLPRKICDNLYMEAKRCRNKMKRGPCAIHHIHYLLRELRDFLGLSKGQVPLREERTCK